MGRNSDTRFSALVEAHSPHKSMSELGRAIGRDNLTDLLGRWRRTRRLPPTKVLDQIADHLDDVGRALLVETLAWDAKLPGYTPEDDAKYRDLEQLLRSLDDDKQRIVITIAEQFADHRKRHGLDSRDTEAEA